MVNNPTADAGATGDMGSIPGLGRSPGGGNGNPLQFSCLENPMDSGAWWAAVHGVTKSRTQVSDWTHFRRLGDSRILGSRIHSSLTFAAFITVPSVYPRELAFINSWKQQNDLPQSAWSRPGGEKWSFVRSSYLQGQGSPGPSGPRPEEASSPKERDWLLREPFGRTPRLPERSNSEATSGPLPQSGRTLPFISLWPLPAQRRVRDWGPVGPSWRCRPGS